MKGAAWCGCYTICFSSSGIMFCLRDSDRRCLSAHQLAHSLGKAENEAQEASSADGRWGHQYSMSEGHAFLCTVPPRLLAHLCISDLLISWCCIQGWQALKGHVVPSDTGMNTTPHSCSLDSLNSLPSSSFPVELWPHSDVHLLSDASHSSCLLYFAKPFVRSPEVELCCLLPTQLKASSVQMSVYMPGHSVSYIYIQFTRVLPVFFQNASGRTTHHPLPGAFLCPSHYCE